MTQEQAEKMIDELKPCPFCGGDDIRLNNSERPDFWTATISCWRCDFGFVRRKQARGDARKEAIEAWNTRTESEAFKALRIVERLQNGEFSQDMMKACEKHLAEFDGDMSAQGMFTAMATQLIKEETHD